MTSAAQAERTTPLLGVVALGSFLTTISSSVLNVALPDIARDLAVSPARAGWFMLSFLLTVTALLLPAGRLGDLVGAGRVYLIGFALFGLGSVACAAAGSAWLLDLARVAQGVGSALVMASSPALTTLSVPPERRGWALGLLSTATYLGLAIGPPVGGLLVAALGWRVIFVAAAAAAAIVLLVGWRAVPLARPPARAVGFDPWGALLNALALLALLLTFTRGPAWGLHHPWTIGAALTGIALLVAFVQLERRHPTPTLDLGLFRTPTFSTAVVAALLNYVALFILLFSLPFALREGYGVTPQVVGRVLAAQAAGMALFAWGAGSLADRIGSRGLAALGMGILALSLGGLVLFWPPADPWRTSLWLFGCGAGTGIFISPNSSALMGSAPRERQGIAGGVMALARNLGMALGVATASGLFAAALGPQRGVVAWSAAAEQAVRTGLGVSAALALVAGLCAAAVKGPAPPRR